MREEGMLMWVKDLPKEGTPTETWRKEWSGFFREERGGMCLAFPSTREEVDGAATALPAIGTRVVAAVETRGLRVLLRLSAASVLKEASIGGLRAPHRALVGEAAGRPELPKPPAELLRRGAGVLSVYVDGSGDGAGGWGVTVVTGGRGGADRDARQRAEHYGPMVLDPTAPPFLGAERTTNQTAELAAFAEGLSYLKEVDQTTEPAIVRPDSEYAMHLALGYSRPRENVALARRVRELWTAEEARRGGQLWAIHVKGHSGHKWNNRADRAAARGAQGFVRGVGARWSSWPPLPGRTPRGHEVEEAQRVMRARHAFGVLAMPVPVHGGAMRGGALIARLSRGERRLDGKHGPQVALALARARAAHLLLSDPVRQRAEADKIIREGLQPVTSELECPVNVPALRRYVERAGDEADEMQYDKRGRPRGTLREVAAQFLTRLGGRESVTLVYQHSLLGAELIASGFVVASREYVRGGTADPFRLPRVVRNVAFTRRGRDMDDSASYPRACLDCFRGGRVESLKLMAHRELILAGIGEYYFGRSTPEGTRRKWTKDLFNSLDMDGTVRGWRRRYGVREGEKSTAAARVVLGAGQVFDLGQYCASREDLTDEFEQLMPGMHSFVSDWLRARSDPRVATSARTAKSYFLQESEGLSRGAKVAWAMRRGDLQVSNLQHDGIVISLGEMTPREAELRMSEVSSAVLGYHQPVEEKPALGEDVSDLDDDA